MHKSAILVELPGKRIDPELLATAAKLYPDGWGCSVVVEDKGNKMLQAQGAAEKISAAGLIKMKEDFEADNFILTVFKDDGEVKEDDLQPYIIMGDEKEPFIVAHLAGTFEKYQDQSGYSAAHQFAKQWLEPRVNVLFQDTKDVQDLPGLMEEMKTNSEFHNEVLDEAGKDAVIIFHSYDDQEVRIYENKVPNLGREFGWGFLSHGEGFEEPKTAKTIKKGTAPVDADSKLIKAEEKSKLVVITIPKMTNNEKRSWIFKRMGRQPDGWQDLTEIVVERKVAEKFGDLTFKDFKEAGKALGEYPPKEEKAATDKQAPQPPQPLIVAEDKKKSDAFLTSLDPAKWKEAETKVSDWSSQMGHDLYDGPKAVVKWPYEEQLRYVKQCPDGAGVLMFQLIKLAAAVHAAQDKKEEKANGKKVIKKTA